MALTFLTVVPRIVSQVHVCAREILPVMSFLKTLFFRERRARVYYSDIWICPLISGRDGISSTRLLLSQSSSCAPRIRAPSFPTPKSPSLRHVAVKWSSTGYSISLQDGASLRLISSRRVVRKGVHPRTHLEVWLQA